MKCSLFVFLWLSMLSLTAQPQADPIRTVVDITPITNALGERFHKLLAEGGGEEASLVYDSLSLLLVGQDVTASYLVDADGKVWNLGAMDSPFAIHTFFMECSSCDRKVESINAVAEAYADQAITFVLLPTPKTAAGRELVSQFNDEVVVVFDDHFRDPNNFPDDPRLLGLIGYPVSHFISSSRKIIAVSHGRRMSFLHPKQGRQHATRITRKPIEKQLRWGMDKVVEQ